MEVDLLESSERQWGSGAEPPTLRRQQCPSCGQLWGKLPGKEVQMLAAGSQAGVHREVHPGGSGQTVGKYATGGLVDLGVRRESCRTNGLAERVCEGAEQGYWVADA